MRNLGNRSGIVPRFAKGFNVLLVDRDIMSLHKLYKMLKKYEFNVSTAAHGMDAVALVRRRKNPIQFILANIYFTDISYNYFLFLLKDDFVPITLMSTGNARAISDREIEGALTVIEKPFCSAEMGDILRRIDWQVIVANKRMAEKKRREEMRASYSKPAAGVRIREPGNNNRSGTAYGVSSGRAAVTRPKHAEAMMNGKTVIIIDGDDDYKGGDRSRLKGKGVLVVEKEQEKRTKAVTINQQAQYFDLGDHQNGNYIATSIQLALMNDLGITKTGLEQQDNGQDLMINNKGAMMRGYTPATAKHSSLIPGQQLVVQAAFSSHSSIPKFPPLPPDFFEFSQCPITPLEFNPGPMGPIQDSYGNGSSNNVVPLGGNIGLAQGFDPAMSIGGGANGPGNISLPSMTFPGQIGPHENLGSYPFGNPDGALQFQPPSNYGAIMTSATGSNNGNNGMASLDGQFIPPDQAVNFPIGSADSTNSYLSQNLNGVAAQFQTTPTALQQVGSYGAVNDQAMNFPKSAAANYPSSYAPQNPNNEVLQASNYGAVNAGNSLNFPSFAANYSSPYLLQNPSGEAQFQSPAGGFGVESETADGNTLMMMMASLEGNDYTQGPEIANFPNPDTAVLQQESDYYYNAMMNNNYANSSSSHLAQNPSYYADFEAYQPVIQNPSLGVPVQAFGETDHYNYSSHLLSGLQNSNHNNNGLFENRQVAPQVMTNNRQVAQVVLDDDEAAESNYFAFNRTFEDVDRFCGWMKENPNGKSISVDNTTLDRTRKPVYGRTSGRE